VEQYDGEKVTPEQLTEAIPSIPLEEKEEDLAVQALSQQSFVHALFDPVVEAVGE